MTDQVFAKYKKLHDAGFARGFLWACNEASTNDLERIYDVTGEWDGYDALAEGLRMSDAELKDICFEGKAVTEAFAQGFLAGAMDYYDSVLVDAAYSKEPQPPAPDAGRSL